MAGASSTINVAITGDARKLIKATKDADKATGKLGGSMKRTAAGIGSAFAGLFAVSKGFEFIQGGLNEFDRLGDATARLNRLVGVTNTAKIENVARSFERLGLSRQDVLELAADFAGLGTAAGISKGNLAGLADDAAGIAAAFSQTDSKGRSPEEIIRLIGKAANGSKKPLQELNIPLSKQEVLTRALKDTGRKHLKNLTDGEIATARLKLIIEKLNPVLHDQLTGTQDLEGAQKELNAKIETFQGELGAGMTPILLNFFKGLGVVEAALPGFSKSISDNFDKGLDTIVTFGQTIGVTSHSIGGDFDEIVAGGSALVADLTEDFTQIIDGVTAIGEFMGETADNINGLFGTITDAIGTIAGVATDATAILRPLFDFFNGGNHTADFRLNFSSNLSDSAVTAALLRNQQRNGDLQRP